MEDQLYREVILERYTNPVNQGIIEKPDLEASLVNPLCGDEVRIQVKLQDQLITKARFSGNGCALSQVGASLVAEYVEGKNIATVKKFASKDLIKILGIRPSPARLKCVLLSLDVLKKSLGQLTDETQDNI